jgi:armadillo repeat-containing protein 8
MAREEGPLFNRLLNANSVAERIAALRALKHELIGHDQRKETWIAVGIVSILSQILESQRDDGRKEVMSDGHNGDLSRRRNSGHIAALTEDQELCLQAVIILGSLAQGRLSKCIPCRQ